MPTTHHTIVCEGQSEFAYLKRLQAFLDKQADTFAVPLIFNASERLTANSGSFGKMKSRYNNARKDNKKSSIKIWADFDLYHRNDKKCAEHYAGKTNGIPDFHFSFHNFEDFYAMHFEGVVLQQWLEFGGIAGTRHFSVPLHSKDYLPKIKRIFPDYAKGGLPADFVSWDSLKNLKANLGHQPKTNPHNLQGIQSFAEFLIEQIKKAYPGKLD